MWRLAVVVVGACSFSPGGYPKGDDASMTGNDAPNGIDAAETTPDTAIDMMTAAGFVRQLDIEDTLVTGGPHTNLPLLVSLTTTWLRSSGNGGDVARTDGFDVYFSSDQLGATRLAHEVEAYDPVAGTLIAWVKVPSLSATTVLYLHYGDPAITTNQAMVTAVWSNGYAAVVHMAGGGDSTTNTTATAIDTGTGAGQIGPARTFDGSVSIVDMGSPAAIDNVFTGGGSVETWIRPTSFGENGYGRIFSKGDTAGWGFGITDTAATATVGFFHGGNGGSNFGHWVAPNNSIVLNNWHHLAVVYDKGADTNNPDIYVNGTLVTETELVTPNAPMDDDSGAVLYGGNIADTSRTIAGTLDEMRVSSVSRSGEWFSTQYQNQSNPGAFVIVSAPL